MNSRKFRKAKMPYFFRMRINRSQNQKGYFDEMSFLMCFLSVRETGGYCILIQFEDDMGLTNPKAEAARST